jgi:hypothetical protein
MAKPAPRVTLSRQTITIIVVIVGLVATAASYFLYSSPAQSAAAKNSSALAAQKTTDATEQLLYTKYQHLGTTAGQQIYQNAQALDKLLPVLCDPMHATVNCFDPTSYSLITLQNLVNSSGLSSSTVSPCTKSLAGPNTYCQYTILGTGSYATVASFIAALSSGTPLTTIASVTASAAAHGIAATITINVWYTTSTTPAPSTGPGTGGTPPVTTPSTASSSPTTTPLG